MRNYHVSAWAIAMLLGLGAMSAQGQRNKLALGVKGNHQPLVIKSSRSPITELLGIFPETVGRTVVGIMGRSLEKYDGAATNVHPSRPQDFWDDLLAKGNIMGKRFARETAVLLNGACPGVTHEVMRGANAYDPNVHLVGITPFSTFEMHKEKGWPTRPLDVLRLTPRHKSLNRKTPNFLVRSVNNPMHTDVDVFINGGPGTTMEFAAAYELGKVLAVLKDSGGIADHVDELVDIWSAEGKPPMNKILSHHNPDTLAEMVMKETHPGITLGKLY